MKRSIWLNLLLLLLLWEVAGQLRWVADGALPAPSAILQRLWIDRADYPLHVWVTFKAAFIGFVIGNLIAVMAAILFVRYPWTARVMRGVNITLFALPAIAIVPILNLTMSDLAPRITLAALGCYFTTMTAMVVGLTQIDARSADLVRAYGGKQWATLYYVQLRSALPSLLSGLRIAAPAAVLGAILAEFGGGDRWGLGRYLLGSLGRGEPERLWGIGLVATLLAATAYGIFAFWTGNTLNASRAVTISPTPLAQHTSWSKQQKLAIGLVSILLPFILWWGIIELAHLPNIIAKTPYDIVHYLFLSDNSATARGRLWAALMQTIPMAVIGIFAGLAFAFLLAIMSQIVPVITRTLMPIALITQTMPLVALTPLLVLILGRGTSVILWIVVSVTFFPAFITLVQGMELVPKSVRELPKAYGASAWQQLYLASIPASLPYLFAAARLAVPKALLGVMIAEWLATGTGLGNLLNQSRGYMDFQMIWTVAAISVLLSVVFYQVVVMIERVVLPKLGMNSSD